MKSPLAVPFPPKVGPALTWGLPVPKPSVGVVGTDMECGPIGELMTEKGGPMPLMGELRVLIGECSCPGEPSGEPIPGPKEGCSEGAAMEPRPVGELRDEEFTWVEKSAKQELARRSVRAVSRTHQLPTATHSSHLQTFMIKVKPGCQDFSCILQELDHLWRAPVGTLTGVLIAEQAEARPSTAS